MVIALVDPYNDCSFAVEFTDLSVKEQVENYMREGLSAWYSATDPDKYNGDLFTIEEITSFYECGYAEPTEILLEKNHISYKLVDIETDNEDYIINADIIVYY